MIVLMMLVFLWMPYVITRLLPTAEQASTPTRVGSQLARAEPPRPAGSDTGAQVWTALDDRQLTRLLTDSAPRTITE